MAQIFISHSKRDTRQIDFLNKAFASSNVQAKYEEIEAIVQGQRNAPQIRTDIACSNAIMVLLGPNVETLKHTRDWVVWESGNPAAANKEVWVLEAYEDLPKLSVVIPHVQHYVCFHYNDSWIAYLRQTVSSYDDSHVAKAALAGAGVGAAFGGEGALLGAGAGCYWLLSPNRRDLLEHKPFARSALRFTASTSRCQLPAVRFATSGFSLQWHKPELLACNHLLPALSPGLPRVCYANPRYQT